MLSMCYPVDVWIKDSRKHSNSTNIKTFKKKHIATLPLQAFMIELILRLSHSQPLDLKPEYLFNPFQHLIDAND